MGIAKRRMLKVYERNGLPLASINVVFYNNNPCTANYTPSSYIFYGLYVIYSYRVNIH